MGYQTLLSEEPVARSSCVDPILTGSLSSFLELTLSRTSFDLSGRDRQLDLQESKAKVKGAYQIEEFEGSGHRVRRASLTILNNDNSVTRLSPSSTISSGIINL